MSREVHAGPADIDVRKLTIAEALDGLRGGAFNSEGLVQASLDQIATFEGSYNSFTFLNEDALADARASDTRRAAGAPIGALEGIPTVLKEPLNFVGKPSTFGWNYTAAAAGGVNLFPLENAAVTQMLLEAGAVIMGKTNIPAFSAGGTRATTSWDGDTYNPINRALVPGASSSGTATATAAGFAIWGIGEETGGSIQNPAGAQSLVGLKPTFGIVPTYGVTPLAGSTRDVLGPICKTTRDAAIAFDVISGYGAPDFAGEAPEGGYTALLGNTTLEGKRLGLWGPGWSNETLSPEVADLYAGAVAELKALGATTVEDPFAGSGFAELAALVGGYDARGTESIAFDFFYYLKTLGIESYEAFEDKVGISIYAPGTPLGERVRGFLEPYSTVFQESLADPAAVPNLQPFLDLKAEHLRIFNKVFGDSKLDALAYPQALNLLPPLDSDIAIQGATTYAINIAGTPVITVPSTRYEGPGAPSPFSLAFAGQEFSEALLLALAYDYEQATQLRIVPEFV